MGKKQGQKRLCSTGDESNDAPKAKVSCSDNGEKVVGESSASLIVDEVIESVASSQSQSQPTSDSQHNPQPESIAIESLADKVHKQQHSIELLKCRISTSTTLQKKVDDLTAIVEQQQLQINTLNAQLSFILSFLNIPEVEQISGLESNTQSAMEVSAGAVVSGGDVMAPATAAALAGLDPLLNASGSTSYAAAAQGPARQQPVGQHSVFEAAVAAVYTDQRKRDQRATNIIITGLPICPDMPDKILVTQMLSKELLVVPDIVQLKRLGRVVSNRPSNQPLLIVLRTAAQANLIIQRAKLLRSSVHSVISDHVYINRHLTHAEARAAYEQRCQKRQTAERRLTQQQQSVTSVVSAVVPTQASAGVVVAAVSSASPFDDLITWQ